ncbi:TetR/AcrR family transcriptional regulator [Nakamurella sp. A5-74]|uniref:TetR/AcrR family transcriptional regulator n=1 Tax=Nakamurella sp. A5-74 TaxID=3158264 RepID=A0AAU8DPX8_9ACTN
MIRPPSPGRTRHRLAPEVRRRLLLQAARSVISERGLHATTIRDVAAAGDVAVGTVTYHFAGIAEVLAGVIDAEMSAYSAPIMEQARAATTGRDALLIITDGLLADGDAARDHWKLWLDFWALSAHDELYGSRQSAIYADLHALIAESFTRGLDDGSLPGTADVRSAALAFVALLDGLVVQCYLPHGAINPDVGRGILGARLGN